VAYPEDPAETSLDPDDWADLRRLGHRMLDDAFDALEGLRQAPVWQRQPASAEGAWREPLPRRPTPLQEVYAAYRQSIAPYGNGNRHPRFFGWVHGGGTPVGMLAEMLAAGLNSNLGGRDHAPIGCERQVIRWAAELLGLPSESSGLLVTGTSIANFMAVLIARTAALGPGVREQGLADGNLVAYASTAVHGCVAKALDMAGLGSRHLRLIGCMDSGAIDLALLRAALHEDRDQGKQPFMVIATAGSVDTGAIDDLAGIACLCRAERLWFHVDAAFGAIAMMSARLRPLFAGIEHADSVAFDFHKWAQVPYDAGCLVVRDRAAHLATFRRPAAYLARSRRGLAAGDPWPCDLGPDLSRGFRALKVWMTLKTFGTDGLGRCVEQSCRLARRLAARIDAEPLLERVAPVPLNVVCFRFRPGNDAIQSDIAAELQELGIAAPSTTVIGGRVVLRAAIVNHRTRGEDVDALADGVVATGIRLAGAAMCRASRIPD
jgi:aromatic-L-amino-acid decarboxylase